MTKKEAIKVLRTESIELGGSAPSVCRFWEALDMAIAALQQEEPNDWVCTLKCTALMDEGMCSHGGLCCLYESQRTIKENQPLTLDELRKMDGEPVWVQSPGVPEYGRWAIVEGVGENCLFLHDDFTCHDYGKTWLAYRQKPEEGTV